MRRSERRRRGASRARIAAALALVAWLLVVAAPVRADDTIKHPGQHPAYDVEIEPHLLLGFVGAYNGSGYGVGARFSIPIVSNGFVEEINNSVAISFGLDLMHYDRCWHVGSCSADYLNFPVVLQWNFFVAKRWSVFGEPGLVVYHGFLGDCPPGDQCLSTPRSTFIEPAIYAGGRYHISDKYAFTMRVGFPSFSAGFSFFP